MFETSKQEKFAAQQRRELQLIHTSTPMLSELRLLRQMLHLEAGKKLSLQRHEKRSEFFFMPNGEVQMNLPGVWHAPSAPVENDVDILEVQIGESEEEDIERISETDAAFAKQKKKKIQLNQ